MTCQINNKSDFDITEIEDLIQDLFSFSRKRFGFKKPPVLNLVSDKNNTSPLGKTAHYDPNNMSITIYVDGRHPKDIMRSFSHELVHHRQNENGMFNNVGEESGAGYAQSNPHLRKMEKEAYLQGNMCFRDWEDGYKSSNPNILNERRIYKMSTKDWKNKELNGLLNERWGFSMDLSKLNENKKPDFPDVDGDGDREEPISQAQKDKKEKDGDSKEDKPKKKAKKGEIPPQLRDYVKGKKKDSEKSSEEDSEEESEEKEETLTEMDPQNNMRRSGVKQGEPVPEKYRDDVEFTSKGKKYILPKRKKQVKESEDDKEKFKKGLKGELDDTADQKVDEKLKQKILDSLTISQLKAALKKKEKKDK